MGLPRGGGAAISQPTKKKRRLTGSRLLLIAVLLVFLGLFVFYGIGGLMFSNQLERDALTPKPPSDPTYPFDVVAASATSVTLRSLEAEDILTEEGTFGLDWLEGSGIVGPPTNVAKGDDGSLTVARSFTPDNGLPALGAEARLVSDVWSTDPETAFLIPYSEREYATNLGAWYIRGNGTTWMIFVHGKGATRSEALRLVPVAFARGYHALVIDYRNDPGAPQDPSGYYQFGKTEWADLAAAVRHARERGAEDVVLVGYSMGGGIVTSFLTKSPLRNQVVAAVLDSPLLDFSATIDHEASQRDLPLLGIPIPSSLTTVTKWMSEWRFGVDWEATDYLSQWRDLHSPMLIFHSVDDPTVPVHTSRSMAALRPDLVTLVETADVGHVRSWNADPDAYETAVNTFLDEHTG